MRFERLVPPILSAAALAMSPPAAAQYAPGPTSPVGDACLAAAREGLLSKKKADWLCLGARSAAPAICYDRARAETTLGGEEAIRLCRCAEAAEGPVTCFVTGLEATTLRPDAVVDRCRPIAKRRLRRNCQPAAPQSETPFTDPYRFPEGEQ
jgi:hypothetical protein